LQLRHKKKQPKISFHYSEIYESDEFLRSLSGCFPARSKAQKAAFSLRKIFAKVHLTRWVFALPVVS